MAEVAVVAKDSYPVRWVGRQAVVTLPEHIDVSNAGQILDELLSVIDRGATTLIADMTATLSCDHAGADAVVRAYPRALANGTQLRLVVTAHIVRHVLSLNGLDRLITIYPPGSGDRRGKDRCTARMTPGGGNGENQMSMSIWTKADPPPTWTVIAAEPVTDVDTTRPTTSRVRSAVRMNRTRMSKAAPAASADTLAGTLLR
jgi:anti-anti-sigma factor